MADLGWLTTYDPRLFIARAIGRALERDILPPEVQDKMVRDAASISHHLMILRFQTVSAQYAAKQGVDEAIRLMSIGLEFASGGDLERAANMIAKNEIVIFFRIGNTLLNRLKRQAEELLENQLLYPPRKIEDLKEDIALIDALPVEVFNVLEKRFLEELLRGRLTAERGGKGVKLLGQGGRSFTTVEDVRIAQKALDELQLKLEYARSLPYKEFFTTRFKLDPTLDFILAATRHLMANLLLRGKPGYRLSEEEIEEFKRRLDDQARRNLLGWIDAYLSKLEKDERLKRFARKFWVKALSNLEEFGKGYE